MLTVRWHSVGEQIVDEVVCLPPGIAQIKYGALSNMALSCTGVKKCENHELKDAGLLEGFRFEYDLVRHAQHTSSHSLRGTVEDVIRSLQEYKDSLPTNQNQEPPVDGSKMVQIQVSKKVLNDRIEAFITRKRKEVDEWNVQEFCSSRMAEGDAEESSCARVDAVLVSRSEGRSHVRVSRVVNQWGPMTKLLRPKVEPNPREERREQPLAEGVHERLRNMESHLKLKSGCSVPRDVYARIKNLEDRILYLEGISPDYFAGTAAARHEDRRKKDVLKQYEDWSMSQIESRIQALQNQLRQQSSAT